MSEPITIFDPSQIKQALAFRRRQQKRPLPMRTPPKVFVPKRIEAAYFVRLKLIFSHLEKMIAVNIIPRLKAIQAQAPRDIRGDDSQARADQFDDEIERVVGQVRTQFKGTLSKVMPTEVRGIAKDVSSAQRKDHVRTWQTVLGINPEVAEPWLAPVMDAFVRQNVRMIEDASDAVLDGVERRVSDGIRQGLSTDLIAKQIETDSSATSKSGISYRRAQFIVRDQIGSFYGDLAKVRQQKLGVERYKWSTSGDERVRPAHRQRDGEIFTWSSIEPQLRAKGLDVEKIEGHPGKPVGCRCVPLPILEDVLEDLPEI